MNNIIKPWKFSHLLRFFVRWFILRVVKLWFVELEHTLFCGRYLELAETNQPPLCKGISEHPNFIFGFANLCRGWWLCVCKDGRLTIKSQGYNEDILN